LILVQLGNSDRDKRDLLTIVNFHPARSVAGFAPPLFSCPLRAVAAVGQVVSYRAMPTDPASSTASRLLSEAQRSAAAGDPAGAARLLRAVLERWPGNAQAAGELARLVAVSRKAAGAEAGRIAASLQTGDAAGALALAAAVLPRAPCHPDLHYLRGLALAASGKLAEARAALEFALVLEPARHDALMALGSVAMRQNDPVTAAAAFRKALGARPGDADAAGNLGLALTEAGQPEEALPHLRQAEGAAQDCPAQVRVQFNLGNCLRALGRADAALAAYDRALALAPDHWGAMNNRGTLLLETGDLSAARDAFRAALALRPDAASARRNLADLHRFAPDDPELARLRADQAAATDPAARMQLSFALGKALDDAGAFDEAFAAFAEGNRLRKAAHGYDPAPDALLFRTLHAMAPPAPLAVAPCAPCPVFVTGLMRSGTSLVEQILAAHPDVAAAGEMEAMTRLALPLMERVAARPDRPVAAHDLLALRDGYLRALQPRARGRAVVTDKMPANFRWIGLILAALPEARILHLSRDPMAVGWSTFRTCFTARGNGHAWDLADIGRYIAWHDGLMAHWRDLYGDRVTVIRYEDLVTAPDGPARVVAAAGLAWHDAVTDFATAETQVRTASAAQVRQGIYRGSSDRWRDYAAHLEPLARAAGIV
jgi:tetratricopeptide (TPR) repeat protein